MNALMSVLVCAMHLMSVAAVYLYAVDNLTGNATQQIPVTPPFHPLLERKSAGRQGPWL